MEKSCGPLCEHRVLHCARLLSFVAVLMVSTVPLHAQRGGPAAKPLNIAARPQSTASKSVEAPRGNAANGKKIYMKYGCYECHGTEAHGVMPGPQLGPYPSPFNVFLAYVRLPDGEMPPYTDKVVSDQEIADMYAFVKSVQRPPDAKSIPLLNPH
jgi:mono/diheme cytochrome c family protein